MDNKHVTNKWNGGFSFVEALAAVAILVILLGLSSVAVAYYRDYLKITELDNAAREIYMAAENRAVLLSGNQHLSALVKKGGNTVTLPYAVSGDGDTSLLADTPEGAPPAAATGYYITKTSAKIDDLLPAGTVDPALMEGEGNFYIVYEPVSGCVTDVFYAEKAAAFPTIEKAFELAKQGRDARMRRSEGMLGYYGGGMADSMESVQINAPDVIVTIHNEDTLWVEVKFDIPQEAREVKGVTVTPEVTLQYDGINKKIDLLALKGDRLLSQSGDFTKDQKVTYSWVLDSLEEGKSLHFHNLSPDFSDGLGKNFTVNASIKLSAPGALDSAKYWKETDNSLFAKDSDIENNSAKLRFLRHLQNLDTEISKAGNTVTSAEQAADIDCGTYLGKEYTFTPIKNDSLLSFTVNKPVGEDTDNYVLRNLKVTRDKVGGRQGAGLFAVSPKDSVKGVRLINASVDGGSWPTGALAGKSDSNKAVFEDCRVYWDASNRLEYQKLLGSTDGAKTDKLNYCISGTDTAGGMVGQAKQGTFNMCLAATLVKGGTVGGLIGAGTNVTVTNSYADCYLHGTSSAAGLIGNAPAATLTNVYTAGFIDKANNAVLTDGILNGNPPHADNVYAAVNGAGDYYCWSGGTKKTGLIYEQMTGSDFAGQLGDAFAFKTLKDSHPYNLQIYLDLKTYSFPGLTALPHYGDWGAQFKEPSLVYYEHYRNWSFEFGFSGGNANYLLEEDPIGDLAEEASSAQILKDGYAVAFLKSDRKTEQPVTVRYTYFDYTEKKLATEEYTYPGTGGELISSYWQDPKGNRQEYCLAPLPENWVTGTPDGRSFFQYLKFELFLDGVGTDTSPQSKSESFYNPHFAETVIPYSPDKDSKNPEAANKEWNDATISEYSDGLMRDVTNGTVSVRTPRHLYDLSAYPVYYHNENKAFSFIFQQTMDLDYNTYDWASYNAFQGKDMSIQAPIGRMTGGKTQPFNSVYDGSCLFIKNVRFQAALDGVPSYAGLFGQSSGTLRNIVYHMGKALDPIPLERKTLYLGALAGQNTGSVDNCAVMDVQMSGDAYTSSWLYIGGLVGKNEGTIQNCAAEAASLAASATTFSHAYVGGFVGQNDGVGQISSSYSVGRVSTDGADNTDALSCGFAGWNARTAVISNSYSAMDLRTNHAGGKVHSFCGVNYGHLSNDRYLNEGNFTYRDEAFNASYTEDLGGASPVKYADLKKNADPEKGAIFSGMETNGNAWISPGKPKEAFPYPTAVKRDSASAHYGSFPKPLELGEMGVYYWEKLELYDESTYRISLLAVDPTKKTITKQSTLSDAHDDGGVVVDYGYGYYTKSGHNLDANGFATEGIAYWPFDTTSDKERLFDANLAKSETDAVVNDRLKKLSEGSDAFDFHSYHTIRQGGEERGLYLASSIDPKEGSRNGTFTLTQTGIYKVNEVKEETRTITVTFTLNPFFADSLAVTLPEQDEKGNTEWRVLNGAKNVTADGQPGSSETNPYGVRSIDQLEFINWNILNHDCRTVVEKSSTAGSSASHPDYFPYLSSAANTVKRYWVQTHDLKGTDELIPDPTDPSGREMILKPYTPIAEYYDTTIEDQNLSHLSGWFGGSFNGQGYVIENVNIQGQMASCAGLFGAVYNGTLQNIILYSSSGKSFVRSGHYPSVVRKETVTTYEKNEQGNLVPKDVTRYEILSGTKSQWYAIGALVGLAASSQGNAVENCAVSGYTIRSHTFTPNIKAWGGIGAGGLLGISNMSLKNCTADTTVRIMNGTVAYDNMRIGGLAGSCQGSITNCYAGGEIVVDEQPDANKQPATDEQPSAKGRAATVEQPTIDEERITIHGGKGMYIGGLVGGSYMKPLQVDGQIHTIGDRGNQTDNTLTNCYSYVRLPNKDCHDDLKGLYMIGGTGEINPKEYTGDNTANHGKCTIENCYYLESEVLHNNPAEDGGYNQKGIVTDFGKTSDHGPKTDLSGGSEEASDLNPGTELTLQEFQLKQIGKTICMPNSIQHVYIGDDETDKYGEYPMITMCMLILSQSDSVEIGSEVYYFHVQSTGNYQFLGWVESYDRVGTHTLRIATTKPSGSTAPGTGSSDEDSGSGPTALTYAQLAGEADIPVTVKETTTNHRIYQLLNDPAHSIEGSQFYPVTVMKDDKYSISGKYSYPPKTRNELTGLNYPFPTILTREGAHIHYGGWPVHGIERYEYKDPPVGDLVSLGGRPIEMDLFAAKDGGSTGYRELLKLTSSVPAGETGKWTVKLQNEAGEFEDILPETEGISADISALVGDPRTATLRVNGKKEGTYTIQIAWGEKYTLAITVRVTAELSLAPHTVTLFPNDKVTVPMKPVDISDNPLPGALALSGVTIAADKSFLAAELVEDKTAEGGTPAEKPKTQIQLTTRDADLGSVIVDVVYSYTDTNGSVYTGENGVRATVTALPEPEFTFTPSASEGENKIIRTAAIDFSKLDVVTEEGTERLVDALTSANLTGDTLPENVTVSVDKETRRIIVSYPDLPVESIESGAVPEAARQNLPEVTLSITLTMEGREHLVTTTIKPETGDTARFSLAPSTVNLFPSDSVTVDMKPAGKNGKELPNTGAAKLVLTGVSPEDSYLKAELGPEYTQILLTSEKAPAKHSENINVAFDYTASDGAYYGKLSDSVRVNILDLPEAKAELSASPYGEKIDRQATIDFISLADGASGEKLVKEVTNAALIGPSSGEIQANLQSDGSILIRYSTTPVPDGGTIIDGNIPDDIRNKVLEGIPEINLSIELTTMNGRVHHVMMPVHPVAKAGDETGEKTRAADPAETENYTEARVSAGTRIETMPELDKEVLVTDEEASGRRRRARKHQRRRRTEKHV